MNPQPIGQPSGRRILFCTDFSEGASAAFTEACDAALRRTGSVLYLLHVVHEPDAQFWRSYTAEIDDSDREARRALDEQIAQLYQSHLPPGLSMQVEIRVGPDAPTILEFAKEAQIDLIVLGRHGHGGASPVFFGRVVEKVVRKAPCAVLVVPGT